jgi:protein transport protein SEC24
MTQRCGRCRAYINPFDTFIRGGTHYTCALCSAVNEVKLASIVLCKLGCTLARIAAVGFTPVGQLLRYYGHLF